MSRIVKQYMKTCARHFTVNIIIKMSAFKWEEKWIILVSFNWKSCRANARRVCIRNILNSWRTSSPDKLWVAVAVLSSAWCIKFCGRAKSSHTIAMAQHENLANIFQFKAAEFDVFSLLVVKLGKHRETAHVSRPIFHFHAAKEKLLWTFSPQRKEEFSVYTQLCFVSPEAAEVCKFNNDHHSMAF